MNKEKLVKKYKTLQKLLSNMKKDHISESSAQCSYYTILSFIPFIILVITLIQYTGIAPQQLFDAISKIIPSSMQEMILGIVQEVYSKSIGTISISIVFSIWSAGRGLFALTKGLQAVYNTSNAKSASYTYLRMRSIFDTIIFIILTIAGVTILVFGKQLKYIFQEQFSLISKFDMISSILTKIGMIFATFIIFLVLYKYMPKHKVSFRSQCYGAIWGGIALNVISYIFSRYLDIFKGFSITYGSLTTLMLIMMWTYSCFYAILLGAEINKLVNNKN